MPKLEAVIKDSAAEDKPVVVDRPEVAVNKVQQLLTRLSKTLKIGIMQLLGVEDKKATADEAEVVLDKNIDRDDIVNVLMPQDDGDFKIIFGPKQVGNNPAVCEEYHERE